MAENKNLSPEEKLLSVIQGKEKAEATLKVAVATAGVDTHEK